MPQAAERLKGDKALLMQRIDRLIIDLEQILVDRAVQELLDLLVVVKAGNGRSCAGLCGISRISRSTQRRD